MPDDGDVFPLTQIFGEFQAFDIRVLVRVHIQQGIDGRKSQGDPGHTFVETITGQLQGRHVGEGPFHAL
jgi:hypothetical protein